MEKRNQSEELIIQFLQRVLIARIATVDSEGYPHVVPVWYGWDGESLWISAFRSTQKVRNIQGNPMISVAIDTTTDHVDNQAVVLEGRAELVEGPQEFLREQITWIYTRYLGEDGVLKEEPQSWIADKENILIKLTPTKIINWGL
jgi:PPOX class probable F420-dependent enzyme